jgi:hypothetical protein
VHGASNGTRIIEGSGRIRHAVQALTPGLPEPALVVVVMRIAKRTLGTIMAGLKPGTSVALLLLLLLAGGLLVSMRKSGSSVRTMDSLACLASSSSVSSTGLWTRGSPCQVYPSVG